MDHICRLCQGKNGKLISPCRCEGSMGYVHPSCLVEWACKKKSLQCEICKMDYILYRKTENLPSILSIEGSSLIFKGFIKSLYQRGLEHFPFVFDHFFIPFINGLCCGYYYSYFWCSSDLFHISHRIWMFIIGYVVTRLIVYFKNVFTRWVEWKNVHDGRPVRKPVVIEDFLSEDEEEDDGSVAFVLPASEKKKNLVRLSDFDQKVILRYFSSQLQANSKNTILQKKLSATIATEVYFLCGVSLISVFHVLMRVIPLFRLVVFPLFAFMNRNFFNLPVVQEIFMIIYSLGNFLLPSPFFYVFMITLLFNCSRTCFKMLDYRRVDNFLVFASGGCMTFFLILLVLVTFGFFSLILYSSSILSKDGQDINGWDMLLVTDVLPIECFYGKHRLLKTGQDLNMLFHFLTEGRNVMHKGKSANLFDIKSCPSISSLSESIQFCLASLVLVSRIDVWGIFLKIICQSCCTPAIIIWTHLLHSKIIWKELPDITVNNLFSLINSINFKKATLFFLKFLLLYIFVDRTIGILCFRIASLMVPGDLQIDFDGFPFSEPFGLLMVLCYAQFYLPVKELYKGIRRYLMNAFNIYEDIEENLIGSSLSIMAFTILYYISVMIIMCTTTVRLYVVIRSPLQLDYFLHFIILGQYVLNLGFLLPVIVTRVHSFASSVKLKLCQLVMLGKYGIFSTKCRRENQVGLMCRYCSYFSSSTDINFWPDDQCLLLKSGNVSLFLPESEALIILKNHLNDYLHCVLQGAFFLMCLLGPLYFPLKNPVSIKGNFFCYQTSPKMRIVCKYGFNCMIILLWIKVEILISSMFSWNESFLLQLLFLTFKPSFSGLKKVFSFCFMRYLLIKCLCALCFSTLLFGIADTVIHTCLIFLLIYVFKGKIKYFFHNSRAKTGVGKLNARVTVLKEEHNRRIINKFFEWFYSLIEIIGKQMYEYMHSEVNSGVYFSHSD